MKPTFVFAVLGLAMLSLAAPQSFAQEASPDSGTEQEVLQAIEKYRSALLQRDTAALEQIWADDYTFVNGVGDTLSKAQRLENIKSRATSLDSITQANDTKVRTYRDTAVVTSRVTIKGQYSGKEASGDYRSMLVWLKTPGGWQLLANQLTPLNSK